MKKLKFFPGFRKIPSFDQAVEKKEKKENIFKRLTSEMVIQTDHKIINIEKKTEEKFNLKEYFKLIQQENDLRTNLQNFKLMISDFEEKLNQSTIIPIIKVREAIYPEIIDFKNLFSSPGLFNDEITLNESIRKLKETFGTILTFKENRELKNIGMGKSKFIEEIKFMIYDNKSVHIKLYTRIPKFLSKEKVILKRINNRISKLNEFKEDFNLLVEETESKYDDIELLKNILENATIRLNKLEDESLSSIIQESNICKLAKDNRKDIEALKKTKSVEKAKLVKKIKSSNSLSNQQSALLTLKTEYSSNQEQLKNEMDTSSISMMKLKSMFNNKVQDLVKFQHLKTDLDMKRHIANSKAKNFQTMTLSTAKFGSSSELKSMK